MSHYCKKCSHTGYFRIDPNRNIIEQWCFCGGFRGDKRIDYDSQKLNDNPKSVSIECRCHSIRFSSVQVNKTFLKNLRLLFLYSDEFKEFTTLLDRGNQIPSRFFRFKVDENE